MASKHSRARASALAQATHASRDVVCHFLKLTDLLKMRLSFLFLILFLSCEIDSSQDFQRENLTIQSRLNQEKFESYKTLVKSNNYDNGAISEINSIIELIDQMTNKSIDFEKYSELISKLDTIKIDGKKHKVGHDYILTSLREYKTDDLKVPKIKTQALNLISIQLNQIIDYCTDYSYKQRLCFDQYVPTLFPVYSTNVKDSLEVLIGFMAFDEEKLKIRLDKEDFPVKSSKRIMNIDDKVYSIEVEATNDNGSKHVFRTEQKLN